MSNNQRSQPNKQSAITPDQFDKFIEVQKIKLQNESKDFALREKDLEHQAKYADKLLNHQAEIEKNRPAENRKTITRFAWIFGLIIILFMLFAGFCIYLNKEDFLYSLLKGIGYIITTLAGYYFGRKSKESPSNKLDGDIQEF